MRATKELIEYENDMPQWIKVNRVATDSSGVGVFEIIIKTWKNKIYKGIVDDKKILDILNNYLPYDGEEKYQPPKER